MNLTPLIRGSHNDDVFPVPASEQNSPDRCIRHFTGRAHLKLPHNGSNVRFNTQMNFNHSHSARTRWSQNAADRGQSLIWRLRKQSMTLSVGELQHKHASRSGQVLSAELCRSSVAFANVKFVAIAIKRRVFCKSMNFAPKDSARLFSEFQFGSSRSCRNADVPTTTRFVERSFTARISRFDRD